VIESHACSADTMRIRTQKAKDRIYEQKLDLFDKEDEARELLDSVVYPACVAAADSGRDRVIVTFTDSDVGHIDSKELYRNPLLETIRILLRMDGYSCVLGQRRGRSGTADLSLKW